MKQLDACLVIFEPLLWFQSPSVFFDLGWGFKALRHTGAPDGIAEAWCADGIGVCVIFEISTIFTFLPTTVDVVLRDGTAEILIFGSFVSWATSPRR